MNGKLQLFLALILLTGSPGCSLFGGGSKTEVVTVDTAVGEPGDP